MSDTNNKFKSLRLALHYHLEATILGNDIYYDGAFGKWVDELAIHFKEIILITHTNKNSEKAKYKIRNSNVSICDLGPKTTFFPARLLNVPKQMAIVRNNLENFDLIGFRVPSLLAPYIYRLSKTKINFFILVGDVVETIKATKISFWKKIILVTYWKWDRRLYIKAAKQSISFGIQPHFPEIYPEISDLKLIHSSTILQTDIAESHKSQDCESNVIVSVSRLDDAKGVQYIVESLKVLNTLGSKCVLKIVGSFSDSAYKNLKSFVEKNQLQDQVEFLGYVPNGPSLYKIYDDADIMVIAHKKELIGQPRTLWEGFARGIPVVATPSVKHPELEDGIHACFTQDHSPEALANSIHKIIVDPELRNRLIKNGPVIAKSKTLELSVAFMLKSLAEEIFK